MNGVSKADLFALCVEFGLADHNFRLALADDKTLKAHSPLRRLLAFGYFVGATFLLRVRLGFAFHELLQR